MFAWEPKEVRETYGPHNWVPSRLGHGVLMCTLCCGTIKEIAVIGDPNHCECNPPSTTPIQVGAMPQKREGDEG